jgi:hypothetical protein
VGGADVKTTPCGHVKGETSGGRLGLHRLGNPTDAYEWSCVAVPSQRNAGVTKSAASPSAAPLEKLFGAGDAVTFDSSELLELKKRYSELKALAEAGGMYLEGLRRDVVRLAALSQPGIDGAALESVVGKMDAGELREFKRVFTKSAARLYPASPQLGGGAAFDTAENPFKI